ncbi:hypothetical protein [Mesobacillus maritimus]|uniref:hypothetical protein n=1 Tax=Mesobacillus maritimus TaxID=1643336 RepID=UPI00384ED8EA
MELNQQKALLLARNIKEFVDIVKNGKNHPFGQMSNPEKLYRLTLIVEEFRIGTIADELLRVNTYTWDEQASRILIERFKTAFIHISEYVQNNYNDLFFFSARIYTLEHDCRLFPPTE